MALTNGQAFFTCRLKRSFFPMALALALALMLVACGGGDDGPQVNVEQSEQERENERISVLTFEKALVADPTMTNVRVALPAPYINGAWPQSGGTPNHAIHHLALGPQLQREWRTYVGRGSDSFTRLISEPVVADGKVFTIDTRGTVYAVDSSNGRRLWRTTIKRERVKNQVGFGGGLAWSDGTLYVTTGHGFVVSLDGANGQENWRYDALVPFRSAPTIADGRIFAVTHDNLIIALDAETGEDLWEQVGITEITGIMGGASPAVSGDTVIAALSSGELLALRVENGNIAWQDSLTRTRRLTPLATLNDIDGDPVVDRGRVYGASHSGRMVSIDIRSGERVWEINVGSIGTPWIAGNYLFVLTVDSELAAISIRDGRVRWVTQLQRFENQDERKDVIRWTGPVLAGDRLIAVSSHGYLISASPYTGRILSAQQLPSGSVAQPVVADQTLYVLTDDAELIAFR